MIIFFLAFLVFFLFLINGTSRSSQIDMHFLQKHAERISQEDDAFKLYYLSVRKNYIQSQKYCLLSKISAAGCAIGILACLFDSFLFKVIGLGSIFLAPFIAWGILHISRKFFESTTDK